MHELVAPNMLDPHWFNLMKHGQQEGRAVDSRSIEVHGQVLRLARSEEIMLEPAEKVYVSLGRYFSMETEREQQERQRKAHEKQEREKEERRQKLNRLRAEAETFNATLHLPVAWTVGMKDVLSGLSENSMGDGRNAVSVDHIWLKEDLQDGRLVRKAGDFLCTSASGSNGKQWSAQTESICGDGDGQPYLPKVTCKACLRIAERFTAKVR